SGSNNWAGRRAAICKSTNAGLVAIPSEPGASPANFWRYTRTRFFAFSSIAVAALQRESRTVPIVFTAISDPVGSGFAQSLARPGGNATGFTNFVPTMAAKWLEVLKEIAPQVQHAALLFNPETAPYVSEYYRGPFEAAAPGFGVQASMAILHQMADIEPAMAALARE